MVTAIDIAFAQKVKTSFPHGVISIPRISTRGALHFYSNKLPDYSREQNFKIN
jgi:hypothetical protein